MVKYAPHTHHVGVHGVQLTLEDKILAQHFLCAQCMCRNGRTNKHGDFCPLLVRKITTSQHQVPQGEFVWNAGASCMKMTTQLQRTRSVGKCLSLQAFNRKNVKKMDFFTFIRRKSKSPISQRQFFHYHPQKSPFLGISPKSQNPMLSFGPSTFQNCLWFCNCTIPCRDTPLQTFQHFTKFC